MTCQAWEMLPPRKTAAITMEQVKAFAIASGDSNPIHLSDEAAQIAGLPGPVLHGMIIVGQVENYLQQLSGYEIVEVQVRFVRPVPVGSALNISARKIVTSAEQLHLRLVVSIDGGPLAAIGETRMNCRRQHANSQTLNTG